MLGSGHTMDVSGTAGVMAREGRLEMNYSIFITLLNTPKESRVDIQLIGRVTIAAGDNARVDTL
jgi:hypothetical protein